MLNEIDNHFQLKIHIKGEGSNEKVEITNGYGSVNIGINSL